MRQTEILFFFTKDGQICCYVKINKNSERNLVHVLNMTLLCHRNRNDAEKVKGINLSQIRN